MRPCEQNVGKIGAQIARYIYSPVKINLYANSRRVMLTIIYAQLRGIYSFSMQYIIATQSSFGAYDRCRVEAYRDPKKKHQP